METISYKPGNVMTKPTKYTPVTRRDANWRNRRLSSLRWENPRKYIDRRAAICHYDIVDSLDASLATRSDIYVSGA